MTSVQDRVREGYRSLAGRTLELYESNLNIFSPSPDDIRKLNQFSDNLKKVRDSGDVRSIDKSGKQNLKDIMFMIDQVIPKNLKPTNAMTSLGLASISLRYYFGIPSFEELARRCRLDAITIANGFSGIATAGTIKDGIKKIYYVFFDPEKPVYSVIVDIHDFYLALQPEMLEIEDILTEKTKIDGYDRLMDAINSDSALTKKRVEIAMASHELNFLKSPEVIAKAREAKVDLERFEAYLRENVPRMNFLTCYHEGDAFIAQRDIIASSPDLQGHTISLKAYELFALIDALSAPFLTPKQKVHEVGVGLLEYFKSNPNQRELLRNSREFHLELTNAYF